MSATADDWERKAHLWASEAEHASQEHRLLFETLALEYGRLARECWPIPGEKTTVRRPLEPLPEEPRQDAATG
jgi:hypothetical protein